MKRLMPILPSPGFTPWLLTLLCGAAFLFPHTLSAQIRRDRGAFNHVVDVTAWQGHRFRITAAVRSICIDSNADAEVWVRIDKPDNKIGFFYNMMDKPIRDSN